MIFYVPGILIPMKEQEKIYSSDNFKFLLPEQLRRCVIKILSIPGQRNKGNNSL
jgi:hypothetical protein